MKKIWTLIGLLAVFASHAQVGIGTATVDNSALLQLNSTSKGLLVPKMTSGQRTGITSPANGLLVYDTDVNQFYFYNGTAWVQAAGPAGSNGTNGTNGNTILSGTTSPSAGIGTPGDFYLRTTNSTLFGPKTTVWPAGVSLIGPTGPAGPAGTSGVASNASIVYSNVTGFTLAKNSNWVMSPASLQIALGTVGALVNVTATVKSDLLATLAVGCSLCYSTTINGLATPIMTAGGADDIINTTFSNSVYRTVTLTGKITPPSAGTYWVGPCFKSPTDDLIIYGIMGYLLILD